MADCFCGCGHKIRFGKRAINKRGAIISGDITPIRSLLDAGMVSPSAEAFVHDGDVLCAALADAVHAGFDPGPEIENATRGFMRFARQNFGTAALGRGQTLWHDV